MRRLFCLFVNPIRRNRRESKVDLERERAVVRGGKDV